MDVVQLGQLVLIGGLVVATENLLVKHAGM